jgi:hypothetical protein
MHDMIYKDVAITVVLVASELLGLLLRYVAERKRDETRRRHSTMINERNYCAAKLRRGDRGTLPSEDSNG